MAHGGGEGDMTEQILVALDQWAAEPFAAPLMRWARHDGGLL